MNAISPTGVETQILTIEFTGHLEPWEIPAFRGAIGQKVGPSAALFHHHQGDQLRYRYPLIQFKRRYGHPTILCLGEGVEAIHRLFQKPDWSVEISGRRLPMRIERMDLQPFRFQVCNQTFAYKLRHWVALNQRNWEEYQTLTGLAERCQFLERKLTGNLLAMAKGLDWHVDQRVEVEIQNLEEAPPMKLKGVPFQNFHLHFRSNISLPQGIGLGGKVSVGMGVVERETQN